MRKRAMLASVAFAVAGAAVLSAQSAGQLVPPGFKVESERNYGQMYVFEATRPNDACPKPHSDPGIRLKGGWTPNPMALQTIEMLARAPEDPPSDMGATHNESMGKERYRNGLLMWHKSTTPWIGIGKGPDLVVISGAWSAAGDRKLLGVSVDNYCGSQEAVRGLLDSVIDKLVK